jgi:hypothetical protein
MLFPRPLPTLHQRYPNLRHGPPASRVLCGGCSWNPMLEKQS